MDPSLVFCRWRDKRSPDHGRISLYPEGEREGGHGGDEWQDLGECAGSLRIFGLLFPGSRSTSQLFHDRLTGDDDSLIYSLLLSIHTNSERSRFQLIWDGLTRSEERRVGQECK